MVIEGHHGWARAIGISFRTYYESEGQEFESLRARQFLFEM